MGVVRPDPFAWLLGAALILAIVAAALAPDRAPALALDWNPIYRAEIALVVLALAYLLGVAGWMLDAMETTIERLNARVDEVEGRS
jgi:hypothetical protein